MAGSNGEITMQTNIHFVILNAFLNPTFILVTIFDFIFNVVSTASLKTTGHASQPSRKWVKVSYPMYF